MTFIILILQILILKVKKFRHLRGALNQCKDMQVKEQSWSEVDSQRVREISEKWIKQKSKYYKKNELGLISRPPVFEDEWGIESSMPIKITS